ncbi:MAG: ABC transporter ATP-binding protein [Eubacteriales bacterium]|nr:ABC transporter ATP-binding protein [Eubacteriales bacterium]
MNRWHKNPIKNEENHDKTLAWLGKVIGKKKYYIAYLLILQVLMAVLSVCSTMAFRGLIDHAAVGEKSLFFRAVLLITVLLGGQMALGVLGRFLYEWSRSSLENRFKERLFACLLHKDYASVVSIHSGEWMNRLTSDTVVVANGIVDILPGIAGTLTKLFGALFAIFLLEPIFIAILIPGGILLLIITYGFRRVLKRLHKRIQETDGEVRVFLQERLESLMIIRTFAMEAQTEEEAVHRMERHKNARIRRNHFSNLCNIGFGVAANGVYLLIAAYCGYGILKGSMSYGTFMAILQLIGQVQSPFANITGYLPRYYAMLASAERLMEAEAYAEDCEEEVRGQQEISRFYRENFKSMGLKDAIFSYSSSEKNSSDNKNLVVLNQMNLEIHKGEYIALTGHSGCGKSTLLKLLMCLYPLDKGEKYLTAIKEESGDTAVYPLTAAWRGMFAYVPQGNHLMSGTIREVIALGDREKMQQEEELNRVLQIACADEFVNTLDKGLDTVLGEKGSGLSEGQMQRIAIARAIFSNHPILVLDESTSALDEATEQKLLKNLRKMTDKTVLIVTHRLAVLQICDRQIRMTEKGIETRRNPSSVYRIEKTREN